MRALRKKRKKKTSDYLTTYHTPQTKLSRTPQFHLSLTNIFQPLFQSLQHPIRRFRVTSRQSFRNPYPNVHSSIATNRGFNVDALLLFPWTCISFYIEKSPEVFLFGKLCKIERTINVSLTLYTSATALGLPSCIEFSAL